MKLPPVQFHLARGGTAPASRRASQRLAADVNNTASKLVNPTSGTPVGAHACRVYNPTPPTFSANVLTAVTWGTESFDIDNWHDNVTNPGRITVDRTGIYAVQVTFTWSGSTATQTQVVINKNGSALYTKFMTWNGIKTTFNSEVAIRLVSGDYVSVSVLNVDAGVSESLVGSAEYDNFFSVALLGTN